MMAPGAEARYLCRDGFSARLRARLFSQAGKPGHRLFRERFRAPGAQYGSRAFPSLCDLLKLFDEDLEDRALVIVRDGQTLLGKFIKP
jgi:hypothetical protein